LEQINAGEDPKKVMDDLDIERYCCRALFMGHVDMLEDIAQFKKF
jgi:DNA-directed RNA polymerase subunit N